MSNQAIFEYHIVTKDGTELIFTNMNEFCKLNKLSQYHLSSMINKGTTYKGWSGYKIEIEKEIVISNKAKIGRKNGSLFEYHLTDTKGNEYVFRDLTAFCKDNNFSKQSIHDLIKDNIPYKGWSGYKIQIK